MREFSAYVDSVIKMESNSKSSYISVVKRITAKRQKEIARWIENEQVLCNPPEAPIWMADYTFKPIGDIKIGDQVVGWEREVRPARSKKTKKEHNFERMKVAKVLEINRRHAPLIKVTMESGRTIRCTKDHLWSNGATYRQFIEWINPKIGRTLRRVVDVYPNDPPDLRKAAWLGGIYDGEGSGQNITQSLEVNPLVYERIGEYLTALGFNYSLYGVNNTGKHGLGRRADFFYILGGMNALARFVAWCKPARRHSLDKRLFGNLQGKPDKIVSIEPDGEGEVISMKTTTGNYVAWGYASKNCGLDNSYWQSRYAWVCDEKGQIFKFQNRKSQDVFDSIVADRDEKQLPIQLLCLKGRQVGITTCVALKFIHRMLFIPHTQAVMASVQKEKSELIERILNTAYERSPWWLVPRRMPRRSFDNGSILSIQSGMQATGIAQGWTPQCLVPTSLVRLADGKTKPISQIETGDRVFTHTGQSVEVVKAWKTTRLPQPTKKIKIAGYYDPFECTFDHRVNTPYGWVEACELGSEDFVRIPVRQIKEKLQTITMRRLPRGLVREDRFETFDVPLNRDLGYLCGFYLAEGTCHQSAIGHKTKKPYYSEIYLGIHRREIERTVNAVKAVIGEDKKVQVKEHGNGAVVSFGCSWLTKWIAENFGTVKTKTVPDWVWDAGQEFCKGVLHGYLDGDGHCADEPGNLVIAPSVCQQLVVQMRDLVASLGLGWCSIYQKDGAGAHHEQWKLILSGPTGYHYREMTNTFRRPMKNGASRYWKWADAQKTAIDVRIESVADGHGEEFWDIEVQHQDHSFLLPQCAVHNCIHISELPLIPNPKNTIEEGLLPATHPSRNLFMVFEGTGAGNVGWFPDFWRDAKKSWPLGLSRMCPVFIPWASATDIYPQADWLRGFPVPEQFMARRAEATVKHVKRCESYIRNTPYLAKVMGRDYSMPVEQQWYWEFEYRQAKERHTLQKFLARMPADDFEALTGIHDSVFDPEVLMEVEDRIYEVRGESGQERVRRQPMGAYAITGHDVDEAFYPDKERIDWSKDCVRVEWDSHRGQHYEWTMIPLLMHDEEIERHTMDCLLVYEWPNNGSFYSCGIDTADGLGKEDEERTCLSVARNRFQGDCDGQVAELTSNRINSAQVVAYAACVGALYGPCCPDSRGIKYAIEQIQGPGDTCQHQLKMMGFFNHHKPRRYDSKKIRDDSTKKEGWYSTAWSVPMLMTRFVEAVNGGWYEPRSKWLIEELRTLERHETAGKSKMEHRSGSFDDRVRAAAQSYFTAHDMDVLTDRAQKRYALPVKKVAFSKSSCTANQVSVGGW